MFKIEPSTVVCIVAIAIVVTCSHHFTIHRAVRLHRSAFSQLLRDAATHAVTAAATADPLLALDRATRALETITVLQRLQGIECLSYVTRVDVERASTIISTQHAKVFKDANLFLAESDVDGHPLGGMAYGGASAPATSASPPVLTSG